MIKRISLGLSILLLASIGSFAQGTGASADTAPSSQKAAKTPVFRPTKEQIRQGQAALKEAKLYTGEATGVYNNDTRSALKAYQKNNGLEVNGKFDKATLEKMNVSLAPPEKPAKTATTSASTASTVKRPAPFQATKEQITALQQKLKEAKLFDGEADGKRSDALKAAVQKYQQANSLSATGGINAATLEKMGIALTDKQKEQVKAQAAYDASRAASKP